MKSLIQVQLDVLQRPEGGSITTQMRKHSCAKTFDSASFSAASSRFTELHKYSSKPPKKKTGAIKEMVSELTLTQTPGTQSERLLGLWRELRPVWPELTQHRHVHQTASRGLAIVKIKGMSVSNTEDTSIINISYLSSPCLLQFLSVALRSYKLCLTLNMFAEIKQTRSYMIISVNFRDAVFRVLLPLDRARLYLFPPPMVSIFKFNSEIESFLVVEWFSV